jgi:hypothetical protein
MQIKDEEGWLWEREEEVGAAFQQFLSKLFKMVGVD